VLLRFDPPAAGAAAGAVRVTLARRAAPRGAAGGEEGEGALGAVDTSLCAVDTSLCAVDTSLCAELGLSEGARRALEEPGAEPGARAAALAAAVRALLARGAGADGADADSADVEGVTELVTEKLTFDF
jgi:hypothetical protein